jgi:HAD superfamily hydrolase (TIGR01509 family)
MPPGDGRLQGVLFDMDGLLVDSEPTWFDVERDVFARLGAARPWSFQDAQALVGVALEVSAARLAQLAGRPGDGPLVQDWLVAAMAERLAAGVPLKPGARGLVTTLMEHAVPTALVSSSVRRLVDVVLTQFPETAFTASVAGDEVAAGKPHPEPYLEGLRLLGVPAQGAVVLEDSPTGATAAQAAGCAVVVVPDRAPLPPSHPWTVVETLESVDPAWLADRLGVSR